MGADAGSWRLAAAALLAAFSACAGTTTATKKTLNALIAEENFAAAETVVVKAKDSEYGRANSVLYHLDLGMVLHQAGRYRRSNEHFALAQARMEELYTISVSKSAGALLANESIDDYAGEIHERALGRVFSALNYVYLGQLDEALVEARKVEAFLDEAVRRDEMPRAYQDDAFARYLSGMLYEDAGKFDDARISYEAARRGYERYEKEFGIAWPGSEEKAQEDYGELVFLHYNGVGPRKIQHQAKGLLEHITKVAYPEYAQDPYAIAACEIRVASFSAETKLVEDITAIAARDLQDRLAGLKARSGARSALKLLGTATGIDASDSEFADTRSWSSLPAQIRMARVKLSPGTYEVEVLLKDAGGAVIATRRLKNVLVQDRRRTYRHLRTAQ